MNKTWISLWYWKIFSKHDILHSPLPFPVPGKVAAAQYYRWISKGGGIAPKGTKNCFQEGWKFFIPFMYIDIHIVHEQMCNISEVLKFHEGDFMGAIRKWISKMTP